MKHVRWSLLWLFLSGCVQSSTSDLEQQVAEMEREIDSLEIALEQMEQFVELERLRADSAAMVAVLQAQMARIAMDSAMAAIQHAEVRRLEAKRAAEEVRKAKN